MFKVFTCLANQFVVNGQRRCGHSTRCSKDLFVEELLQSLVYQDINSIKEFGLQRVVDTGTCSTCIWLFLIKSNNLHLLLRLINDADDTFKAMNALDELQRGDGESLIATGAGKIDLERLKIVARTMMIYEVLFEVMHCYDTLHFMLKKRKRFETFTKIIFQLCWLMHYSVNTIRNLAKNYVLIHTIERLKQYQLELASYIVEVFFSNDCTAKHFKWLIKMDENEFFCERLIPYGRKFALTEFKHKFSDIEQELAKSPHNILTYAMNVLPMQIIYAGVNAKDCIVNEVYRELISKWSNQRGFQLAAVESIHSMITSLPSLWPYEKEDRRMDLKLRMKCSNEYCNKSFASHRYGREIEYTRITDSKVESLRGLKVQNKWYKCKKCRKCYYCCRKCQKLDWNRGDHKAICNQIHNVT